MARVHIATGSIRTIKNTTVWKTIKCFLALKINLLYFVFKCIEHTVYPIILIEHKSLFMVLWWFSLSARL